MIHLATYNNELEAKLLVSKLQANGIEHKISQEEGSEECTVLVFEDDIEEAREILESGFE